MFNLIKKPLAFVKKPLAFIKEIWVALTQDINKCSLCDSDIFWWGNKWYCENRNCKRFTAPAVLDETE